MSTILLESLRAWWPEAILSLGALAALLGGAALRRPGPALGASWVAVLVAGYALLRTPQPAPQGLFFGLIICDPMSLALRWIALATIALTLLLVSASRELEPERRGECAGLLLLIGVGLMLMAEANHLLMAYVSLELVSLSSYLLVGFLRTPRSAEAGLKYLLFGALSSGIMLFGMSLLYGLTGALGFPDVLRGVAAAGGAARAALLVAVALLLAGVAFKLSMVPFHLWTPDAYEGAPIPIAAMLSVGPKAAGIALLLRFLVTLQALWPALAPWLLALTALTMTLGNLVALVQTNLKRLFAYSTIAQAGYLLIGVAVGTRLGLAATLVYLSAYLFMNLGVFACILAVVNDTGQESLDAFRGLSRRAPALALITALFLLSLAGIPPLFGFVGKFLLFGSALAAQAVWLAVAAAVNSAIALYYYVNLIRLMYFVEPVRAEPLEAPIALRVAVWVCAVATVLFGLVPGPILAAAGGLAIVRLL